MFSIFDTAKHREEIEIIKKKNGVAYTGSHRFQRSQIQHLQKCVWIRRFQKLERSQIWLQRRTNGIKMLIVHVESNFTPALTGLWEHCVHGMSC